MTANKLQESRKLKEADQTQQPQQQQPQAVDTQQPQQANGNVDSAQLEKAFEAALENVKSSIIKEFQTTLEKFGEQLVKNLKNEGGNTSDGNTNGDGGDSNNDQQQSSATNESSGTDNNNNQEDNQ